MVGRVGSEKDYANDDKLDGLQSVNVPLLVRFDEKSKNEFMQIANVGLDKRGESDVLRIKSAQCGIQNSISNQFSDTQKIKD